MKKFRHILPIALIVAALIISLVPATPVYAATSETQVVTSTDDASRRLDTPAWDLANIEAVVGSNGVDTNQFGSGNRFINITIPQGSTISAAHIHVTSKYTLSGIECKSRISAEDVDDAATFADDAGAFDTRWAARTTARVDWDNIPTWTADVEYESPSIVTVIQEVVDRGSWASGNDIVIFWEDFEGRTAEVANKYRGIYTYDSTPAKAMKLHITYTTTPSVTTNAATLVEETTSTLNANLTDLAGYSPVYAYFQYGLTTGYGTNTSEQTKTGTGTYLQAIADLSPGTTYHFRAAVKYDASYVYGADATLNTKPLACTGVSATTGETSVTLNWTKGTGANTTVIRRSTTAFPTTPASGNSVYAGTGTEVIDDTLVTNQLYYYSLWSKSSAAVYSDTYVTINATPSGDVLSPPDELQIIDVKVFSSYLEYEDQLYVVRYKIIYNTGDPSQDCADYFNFELFDGATLKGQWAVRSWGYKPGSVYLSTLSTPDWGGSYTLKLRGNDIAWGNPPVTQWNLTSGDWMGADLTQLDTWVITVAESLQSYYGTQMVTYATTGTVLSEQGGIIFNMGIPGLSIHRPGVFSTASEFPGSEPTEHDTSYADTEMTTTNLGPDIAGLIDDGADILGVESSIFGGLIFGCGFMLLAFIIGFIPGVGPLIGMSIASPLLIAGAWFGLVPPALLMVIALLFAFLFIKAMWLHGV